jgi:hypothetical protein
MFLFGKRLLVFFTGIIAVTFSIINVTYPVVICVIDLSFPAFEAMLPRSLVQRCRDLAGGDAISHQILARMSLYKGALYQLEHALNGIHVILAMIFN